jgi:hypothetical protein
MQVKLVNGTSAILDQNKNHEPFELLTPFVAGDAQLSVVARSKTHCRIYDVSGSLEFEASLEASSSPQGIKLENLPAGIYFIKNDQGQYPIFKFVKTL